MKFNNYLSIIILLVSVCKINADICQTCILKGDPCTKSYNITDGSGNVIGSKYEFIGSCADGQVCGPKLLNTITPEMEDWVCRDNGKINQSCYNGLKCADGLFCNKKKICVQGSFSQLNDGCVRDVECAGYYARCVKSKCVKTTNECISNDDCTYDQVCDKSAGQCKDYLFSGDECNINNNLCFNGLECLPSGKCGRIEGLQFGSSCSLNYTECDTSKGLYCSPNSLKCELYTPSNPNTCGNDIPGDSQCDMYHECSCSDSKCYQSKPLPTQANKFDSLVECAFDNECQMISNMASNRSCVYKNCQRELCDYKTDFFLSNPLACGNAFNLARYCTFIDDSSSASQISIISIYLILLIALFLNF